MASSKSYRSHGAGRIAALAAAVLVAGLSAACTDQKPTVPAPKAVLAEPAAAGAAA
ncbi:hypothetical protein [uncultured Xylophilus sp.]|uniref:hypothetical protein n=1 Tax=uncultured Xylophilus sp. TaxID=296832 RepID=UPI0025F6315E|nr:hypothetical protein [uncultured Xylophilus sp.]